MRAETLAVGYAVHATATLDSLVSEGNSQITEGVHRIVVAKALGAEKAPLVATVDRNIQE